MALAMAMPVITTRARCVHHPVGDEVGADEQSAPGEVHYTVDNPAMMQLMLHGMRQEV